MIGGKTGARGQYRQILGHADAALAENLQHRPLHRLVGVQNEGGRSLREEAVERNAHARPVAFCHRELRGDPPPARCVEEAIPKANGKVRPTLVDTRGVAEEPDGAVSVRHQSFDSECRSGLEVEVDADEAAHISGHPDERGRHVQVAEQVDPLVLRGDVEHDDPIHQPT